LNGIAFSLIFTILWMVTLRKCRLKQSINETYFILSNKTNLCKLLWKVLISVKNGYNTVPVFPKIDPTARAIKQQSVSEELQCHCPGKPGRRDGLSSNGEVLCLYFSGFYQTSSRIVHLLFFPMQAFVLARYVNDLIFFIFFASI